MRNWFGKKESQPEVSPGGSIIQRYTEHASSPIGLPDMATIELSMKREEVYLRRFGEASQVSHEFIPLIPHIDVMEYYRASKDGRVCVLVTSGMSDLPMNVPAEAEAPRRTELIFYCTEPNKQYIKTMHALAHFPHNQKTWIGEGHTIPNGNPPEPLWGTLNLDTIFLMPPIVIKDLKLEEELVLDGDGVRFLWVVPLSTAECNLKLEKGANAILDLFRKHQHSHVFTGDRRSYV
jgi:hypothetical protein